MIELLVTIGIASILASIAVPAFTSVAQQFNVSAEVNDFSMDIQFARSEAIKRSMPITLCPSTDGATCISSTAWHSGWIIFTDPLADQAVGTILKIKKGFKSSNTFNADNSMTYLTFSRDGFTTGLPGAGLVTIADHTSSADTSITRCVAIEKTGRHSIQSAGVGSCL